MKKQMIGAVVFSLICSIVLFSVLLLVVTSTTCYMAVYATDDPFEVAAWVNKVSKVSAYILVCLSVIVFVMNAMIVLLYKVNNTLWDKVHKCKNDEGFTIMKLIPDVKNSVLIFEKIGGSLVRK